MRGTRDGKDVTMFWRERRGLEGLHIAGTEGKGKDDIIGREGWHDKYRKKEVGKDGIIRIGRRSE